MRFEIRETKDSIEYVLSDRGNITDEQLADMCLRHFYSVENGIYIKRFPKDRLMFKHDFEAIEERYNIHQNKALTSGFTDIEFEQALEWVISELGTNDIKWWLAGSGALYIRGFDVSPGDIDIMTYKTEIAKIRDAFTPYIIEPFYHVTGWVVKGFGCIDHSFEIDFGFEPEDSIENDDQVDFGRYAESHLESKKWKSYDVLIPPLETHLLPNERRHRRRIVDMIRKSIAPGA